MAFMAIICLKEKCSFSTKHTGRLTLGMFVHGFTLDCLADLQNKRGGSSEKKKKLYKGTFLILFSCKKLGKVTNKHLKS